MGFGLGLGPARFDVICDEGFGVEDNERSWGALVANCDKRPYRGTLRVVNVPSPKGVRFV